MYTWLLLPGLKVTCTTKITTKDFTSPLSTLDKVAWEPAGMFTCSCDIDVTYYPFDDQICTFIFANWAYTGAQINLTQSQSSEEQLMEKYTQNAEWEVIGTNIQRQDVYYGHPPDSYPEVHFSFHLRRRNLFYTLNIIIPSAMLTLLVLLVFRLPPDAGEKISFGVTILLSYIVFILLISDNLPTVSNAVPLIRKSCWNLIMVKLAINNPLNRVCTFPRYRPRCSICILDLKYSTIIGEP